MVPIRTTQEVYDAIQQAKAGAVATTFCTNFYPTAQNLEMWIAQSELEVVNYSQASFFLRRDRDFWHLYFCSSNTEALRMALNDLEELKTKPIVTDVVGSAQAVCFLLPILEGAGLFTYKQLARMARIANVETTLPCNDANSLHVTFAENSNAPAILGLIESRFNCYAKNIPAPREIAAVIEGRQILIVQQRTDLAGLLFFETHGSTSTLRFWAVAEGFRDLGVGSALMRHYFASHPHVRRFLLWVNLDNEDAIRKYQHYHYIRDGVFDYVLANEWIAR